MSNDGFRKKKEIIIHNLNVIKREKELSFVAHEDTHAS